MLLVVQALGTTGGWQAHDKNITQLSNSLDPDSLNGCS